MRVGADKGKRGRWLAACVAALMTVAAQAAEVTVPGNYPTIQGAIDALDANPLLGDTVIVETGTYTEHVQMRSNITVRGRETARTFLLPEGRGTTVSFAGVSNAVIANFTFLDADVGVDIGGSTDITVAGNVFDLGSAGTGVSVTDGSSVSVLNNTFYANGTGLSRSVDNTIVQNNIFAANTTAIISNVGTANISYQCYNANAAGTLLGDNIHIGDPLFTDAVNHDFHLRQGSPCIDGGLGTDVIDDTVADLGAYGGDWADTFPFPVPQPTATDTSAGSPPPYNIALNWSPNLSYLVTNSSSPGGYKIYYDSDNSGPPYNGAEAQDVDGLAPPSPIDVGNVTDYVLRNLSPATATPAAPELQAATPNNQRIALTWSAVDGASDYRLHYGVADTAEHEIDVGNVTSYTLSGLNNGTTYVLSVSALAQTKYYIAVSVYDRSASHHESVLSPETSLILGPQHVGLPSNELRATPEEVVPYPALPNEGCFIATAAYGYYSAPQVRALRAFRDTYLLTNAPGRAFVRWYYRNSPPAARYISMHPTWKAVVRVALLPAVALAWLLIHGGNAAVGILIAAILAAAWLLTAWRRRIMHRVSEPR
jgi:hypothetical protein